MNAAPSSGYANALASLRHMLWITLTIIGFFSVIAIAWRFLDIYETSVRAETVHAHIAMERHKYWLEMMKTQATANPPTSAKALSPTEILDLTKDPIDPLSPSQSLKPGTPAK